MHRKNTRSKERGWEEGLRGVGLRSNFVLQLRTVFSGTMAVKRRLALTLVVVAV